MRTPYNKQIAGGSSGKPPTMNQACLYKSHNQNNISISAQATIQNPGQIIPFEPDSGVIIQHISSMNTPTANAMLRSAHAAMTDQYQHEH